MDLQEQDLRKKEIFEKIAQNDAAGLKSILLHMKVEADLVDENGMTPLQHACYKGNKEMAQMLIDQGADVNVSKHKHDYSALHFAALSGNSELCELLLSAGAKSHSTNSVGRTAAQMASFVGNHGCVAVIHNFIPRSQVDYYTVPHGLETEPKLPPHLAAPLHKFIMQVNLNPLRIAMNLHGVLLENLGKVSNVLELMRERESKRGSETNEIAAFKFHYLKYITDEIIRLQNKQQKQLQRLQEEAKSESGKTESKDTDKDKEERKWDPVEAFAKNILKHPQSNAMSYQELFLRECIREYPDRESVLFRQMVASLAPLESPTALSIITSAINGTRAFDDSNNQVCGTCGEENPRKTCSKCRQVRYCDRECQRYHWFIHKKECARLGATASTNANTSQDASTEVSKQMTELQKRNQRSISSEDSGVLIYMAKADTRSLASASRATPALSLLRTPIAASSSHSRHTDHIPSRKLTLTELREPSSLFTSRTPVPSVLEASSVLETEMLSKPASYLQPPEPLSSVVDPCIAKKLRLNHRYPLLPEGIEFSRTRLPVQNTGGAYSFPKFFPVALSAKKENNL